MSFGATILDADDLRLTKDEKAFFRDADPFAFILFARNVDTPDQVYGLCSEMREAVGREAFVTLDQEGGRVQRLRGPTWREWSPPLDCVAAAGDEAERAMYVRYRLLAEELKGLTIDSNCAPTLDLALEDTHKFLKNRCYSHSPEDVAILGRAVAQAHLDAGVVPIMKHMPGHGRATLDTHFDLPHVDLSLDALMETDFAPFKALNDLPMGMSAHIVFDAIDDAPATLSADVIRVIRDDIGFDGLLMTDDAGMKALQGTPAEIARRAIAAGIDAVLYCNASLADRIAVAEAVGQMSDAAQTRADAALAARTAPTAVDIAELNAEFEALLGGHVDG